MLMIVYLILLYGIRIKFHHLIVNAKHFFPVFYLCHVYVIDFFNPGKYKSKDRVVGCHWFEFFKVLIKSAVSNVYMYIDIFTNVASAISNYM